MNPSFIVIAVDGGAASGKSSTSKLIAEKLNLLHADTGAHYRALTFTLLDKGISANSPETVVIELNKSVALDTSIEGRSAIITINCNEVSENDLRSPAVNQSVSQYSAIPELRSFLLDYQRSLCDLAKEKGYSGIIMEGRDVGSVVLPDADFRFFLEADPETRTQRRALQGQKDSITERDKVDSSRKAAPLKCPEGATRIDSSHLSLEQVVDFIINQIHNSQL